MSTTGPVAVGGLGGSGTRVVARILQELGFYIGADLNKALDNLWFTVLFKRPEFVQRCLTEKSDQPIRQLLQLFLKGMRGELELERDQLQLLTEAATDICVNGVNPWGGNRGAWAFERVATFLHSQAHRVPSETLWGWKEPNTHIFLPQLVDVQDLRYIHVIRHGLDMAFSRNQTQLRMWGSLYGVATPSDTEVTPRTSLRYWIAANQHAVDLGTRALGERFHTLYYDRLSDDPEPELRKLLDFLGSKENTDRLIPLLEPSSTQGRHQEHDLAIFSDKELNEVEKLGFVIS